MTPSKNTDQKKEPVIMNIKLLGNAVSNLGRLTTLMRKSRHIKQWQFTLGSCPQNHEPRAILKVFPSANHTPPVMDTLSQVLTDFITMAHQRSPVEFHARLLNYKKDARYLTVLVW